MDTDRTLTPERVTYAEACQSPNAERAVLLDLVDFLHERGLPARFALDPADRLVVRVYFDDRAEHLQFTPAARWWRGAEGFLVTDQADRLVDTPVGFIDAADIVEGFLADDVGATLEPAEPGPCPVCDQASVTVDGCCIHCGADRTVIEPGDPRRYASEHGVQA